MVSAVCYRKPEDAEIKDEFPTALVQEINIWSCNHAACFFFPLF